MYDIIGDIHGHADELVELLGKLGYRRLGNGAFRHPARTAVFVGDLIDRGPKVRQAVEIVREMVEAGSALVVLGNHEWNALGWHTADPDTGEPLREHSTKNWRQHQRTLEDYEGHESALASTLAWFRTLPFWLELDGLRVIHACWDGHAADVVTAALRRYGALTDGMLAEAFHRRSRLFSATDTLLKGKELRLPEGQAFSDKDGHPRRAIRARWYLPPEGQTYATYALMSDGSGLLDSLDRPLQNPLDRDYRVDPYPTGAPPIFFGHYWLRAEVPTLLAANVACVDWSVAKGGRLCAYRWDGEQLLRDERFVGVPSRSQS